MANLAFLSRHHWTRRGELRPVPYYFAGRQARGDEYNAPTAAVVAVGRRFVIEADEQGRPVLVLLGEGHGQFMCFDPERVLFAAAREWYGMQLIWDDAEGKGESEGESA